MPKSSQQQQQPYPNTITIVTMKATDNKSTSTSTSYPITKTDEQWREELTAEQYYILRKQGTETPGASPLNFVKDSGTFCCAGCGSPLFVTGAKYDSGTGWPSFFAPISSSAIDLDTDYKLLLPRTECSCSQCGGHLGHVFEDGPEPTGQRYCMNGAAMVFHSDEERPDLAEFVKDTQQKDPFKLTTSQVLPSVIVNGLISTFFVSSFLQSQRMTPVEYLILVPALYYGFITVRNASKML
jgi:peptide-methionine (R)-S-oxide reductase